MIEGNIYDLWPVPIYETHIEVKNEWIDFVKCSEYQRMESNAADYTKDFYLLNQLPELKKEILEHKNNFFYNKLGASKYIKLELENSWANRFSSGDFAVEHSHHNSMLSGCVYFDVSENSGDIKFIKPELYNNLFNTTVNVSYENYSNYNCGEFRIKPTKGTLLFFPSWMPHAVEVNQTKNERYSVAFNFFARGKFGNDYEGQLKI